MDSQRPGRRVALDAAVARLRDELPAARFVDTPGAAAILFVTRKQLENWRTLGCGPAYIKVGRLVRYAITDLEEWMAARRVSNTSQAVQP